MNIQRVQKGDQRKASKVCYAIPSQSQYVFVLYCQSQIHACWQLPVFVGCIDWRLTVFGFCFIFHLMAR